MRTFISFNTHSYELYIRVWSSSWCRRCAIIMFSRDERCTTRSYNRTIIDLKKNPLSSLKHNAQSLYESLFSISKFFPPPINFEFNAYRVWFLRTLARTKIETSFNQVGLHITIDATLFLSLSLFIRNREQQVAMQMRVIAGKQSETPRSTLDPCNTRPIFMRNLGRRTGSLYYTLCLFSLPSPPSSLRRYRAECYPGYLIYRRRKYKPLIWTA